MVGVTHRAGVRRSVAVSVDERGSVLVIVLVIMILAMTIVAALFVDAQTSVRSERSYKKRTEAVGRAEDAMAFLISSIRRPPNLTTPVGQVESRTTLVGCASGCGSSDGQPFSRTFKTVTVTCTADAGSGAAKANGTYNDRTVSCATADTAGRSTFHFQLRFVDQSGTNLGQAIQVLDSDFGGG